jgi:hypothetical protein
MRHIKAQFIPYNLVIPSRRRISKLSNKVGVNKDCLVSAEEGVVTRLGCRHQRSLGKDTQRLIYFYFAVFW